MAPRGERLVRTLVTRADSLDADADVGVLRSCARRHHATELTDGATKVISGEPGADALRLRR